MVAALRSFVLGLAFSAVMAGAAAARDYIVVGSTDPAVPRGQSFESGARLTLPPGRTLTLMHASGDIVILKGAAGGVVVPKRAANRPDDDRLAVLKVMVAPDDRPPAQRNTRTRAGVCPAPSNIFTLDAIVQVHRAGCAAEATQALEAWIASHSPAEP